MNKPSITGAKMAESIEIKSQGQGKSVSSSAVAPKPLQVPSIGNKKPQLRKPSISFGKPKIGGSSTKSPAVSQQTLRKKKQEYQAKFEELLAIKAETVQN